MATSWLKFIFEELSFVKTLADLQRFCGKMPYLAPRVFGVSHKHTLRPLSLQVEPTNHCNISCICCPRSRLTREKGYMDFNLFKGIVNDASRLRIGRVHMYLHGEPLLHPQLINMVREIKAKNIGVTLVTNGVLMDEQCSEALISADLNNADHIVFSIQGYSKEVHEKIMVGVEHEKVLENIKGLLAARGKRRSNGPIIETVLYEMPENVSEKREFVKYWKHIVDHVRDVGGISYTFATKGGRDVQSSRVKTCNNLWERMTILWNGDVTLCPADLNCRMKIDNVRNNSIENIWNKNIYLKIKKLHKEKRFNELSLCATCDL